MTEQEVLHIINSKACKSASCDPIPSWLFKSCLSPLLPVLSRIINESLRTGSFPNIFKHAVITPLLKKCPGKKPALDPTVLCNYRPISNLCYISKCLERVVSGQLQTYLRTHELYDEFQAAYQPNHSTETALMRVNNDILQQLDIGNQVVLLMLDLSAAFDTVDHVILLNRLKFRYGLDGKVLQWVESYLLARSQAVKLGNDISATYALEWGVPQGSVLGPTLFSLYMGPLGDIFRRHKLSYMCYADDSQLYISFSENHSSELSRLDNCLSDIRSWMLSNKLKLNDSKTEVMHISSRFRPIHTIPLVSVGDTSIDYIDELRNLGVIFDNHMTMDQHIKHVCQSALSSIRYIGLIRKYLNRDSCSKLVHAFVTSKLDYCNSILYGLPGCKLDRLQRVLNTAARLVTRTRKYEHITPTMIELHWLPIRERINFKLLMTVFKCLHNEGPSYLSNLFQLRPASTRSLRSNTSQMLLVPRVKTQTYGLRTLSANAPLLWNSLPEHVKMCKTVNVFKQALKTYLFTKTYRL